MDGDVEQCWLQHWPLGCNTSDLFSSWTLCHWSQLFELDTSDTFQSTSPCAFVACTSSVCLRTIVMRGDVRSFTDVKINDIDCLSLICQVPCLFVGDYQAGQAWFSQLLILVPVIILSLLCLEISCLSIVLYHLPRHQGEAAQPVVSWLLFWFSHLLILPTA